jgi:uncharacterized protein YndB with AHSA1/START domain
MAIKESIEINRRPEDVFAYLDDAQRHPEWQDQVVAVEPLDGPLQLGTRVTETRRLPGGDRKMTYEITAYDPPRQSQFRVLDGPLRPYGTITVDPAGDGSRSRVTFEMDFTTHGLGGKLLAPMARKQAAKQVVADQAKLKERLEAGA